TPKGSFDEVYRTATVFLAKPWKLWAYGGFEHKRLVAKLAFTGPLPSCPNEGYRTANMALPFKVLAEISSRNSSMVEEAGECSNQLFEVLEDWSYQLRRHGIDDLERFE
ncbi:MAG: hypothetical protein AAF675_18155, partial [Pseudomonadota bacterium]